VPYKLDRWDMIQREGEGGERESKRENERDKEGQRETEREGAKERDLQMCLRVAK